MFSAPNSPVNEGSLETLLLLQLPPESRQRSVAANGKAAGYRRSGQVWTSEESPLWDTLSTSCLKPGQVQRHRWTEEPVFFFNL